MKYFKRILAVLSLAALVGTAQMSGPAHAQQSESEGIGISPTRLNLSADPGQTVNGKFMIINPGNVAVDYKIYVQDFRIRNEDYEKDYEVAEGAVSPVDWFSVPSGTLRLAPNDRKEFDYQIAVPKDAVPRGYYAVIFAETADTDANTTGVNRRKRVGSLVYLKVQGGAVEKGSVASFTADRWQQDRPIKTTLRIQNEGNVHFDLSGDVRLKDVFGRTVAKTELSSVVMPGTIRKLTPELKLNQPFGIYKLEGDAKHPSAPMQP